ncbi:hypothetical protein POJ06DRAFT_69743 [Lipomyces tetrasporus]|uniref:ATP synthase F0 n=1 Tax=Lipomyces tetrasporus TaxID=54092 RepID=A0AAD7QUI7_9ASCO|nr:uncharacterized protein POJ06DRAFT_69743 [Lipomyces tetrasporus]KAJ8101720.1 hypothetical protein POJ06DRAFT_69743 [Lipomyces tetrasporus]
MPRPNRTQTQRTAVLISFIVSIVVNFFYLSGHGVSGDRHNAVFHLDHTPFTPNYYFLILFWAAAYLAQIAYLHQLFAGVEDSRKAAEEVGWFVTVFNTLHFIWLLFIAHGHSVVAFIVVIFNFLFTGSLYWQKRTHMLHPRNRWLTIHIGAAAMPFAWTLFAIFWSGAVAVHSHSLVGRIFANIFIWALLVVPTTALFVFADWSFGYASAFLTWGLAAGQIAEKTFALQWIFAVIIATIITLESAIVMFAPGFTGMAHNSNDLQEVLDNVREGSHEETALIES